MQAAHNILHEQIIRCFYFTQHFHFKRKMNGSPFLPYSRRSAVYSLGGMCASTQPLASRCGQMVLDRGGNAADAAVAMAAALNVTEPCSTGIGGDAFCLYYDASSGAVKGINGSGRSPAALSLGALKGRIDPGARSLPLRHALTVTVPGAAACWFDTVEKFGSGKLTMDDILAGAIDLAERGFPVSPIAAHHWQSGARDLIDPEGSFAKKNGDAPRPGDIMRNSNLARTFRTLAQGGKSAFYSGRIAKSIVECVQTHGGLLAVSDLERHTSQTDIEPIYADYNGVRLHEVPPNGQGLTALIALNILSQFEDISSLEHNSAPYLHLVIEALRLAFADAAYYVCDLEKVPGIPIEELLSKTYARSRSEIIDRGRAMADPVKGCPVTSSDTVYFTAVDAQGNACSFINSNYCGFGTGLVPSGCGFTLQNRGANFVLAEGHPNCLAPSKRPYHTITTWHGNYGRG